MAALVGYGIVAMAALGYGGPSPKPQAVSVKPTQHQRQITFHLRKSDKKASIFCPNSDDLVSFNCPHVIKNFPTINDQVHVSKDSNKYT